MLQWIYPPSDFLTKVRAELEDYKVPGVPNISNKYAANLNNIYMLFQYFTNFI